MTTLCYTLDEAARKLGWSETVLVRMSQYFKVPENAYEESGFLSFKGDIDFTDADIHFFNRVKEHLLAGDSLSNIKRRMVRDQGHETSGYSTPHLEPLAANVEATFEDYNQGQGPQVNTPMTSANASSAPMYAYPDGSVQPVVGTSAQVDAFDTEYLNTTFGEPMSSHGQQQQPMRGPAYQPVENEMYTQTTSSSFSENADVITQTADRQFEVYKERQRNQRTGFFQRLLNRVEKTSNSKTSMSRNTAVASPPAPVSNNPIESYSEHQHYDARPEQHQQASNERDWQVIPSFMRRPKHDEPVLEDYPVIRKQETVLAQEAVRETIQPLASPSGAVFNEAYEPRPQQPVIPVPSPHQQKTSDVQNGYASQPDRPLLSRLTNAPASMSTVFHQRHPQSVEWAGFIQEAMMVRPTVLDPELKMAARYLRLKALKTG